MRKLPSIIDGYLSLMRDCESPTKFLEWVAVGGIAAALQRKTFLEWGDLTFYPNFYIVLVAPPGLARKGTAIKPMKDLLVKLGINLGADSTTRAQLVRRLTDSMSTYPDEENNIVRHSSLTVISFEFDVFFGYKDNQLVVDLTDWYDCADLWKNETKKDVEEGVDNTIYGVFLNIIGATTPDALGKTQSLNMIGGGLSSRIIFVFEPRRRHRIALPMFPKTPEGIKIYENLLHDLNEVYRLRGRFKYSTDFLHAYADWYNELPEECPSWLTPDKFSGYWSRKQNHLFKLSMIQSASRSNDLILELEDFENAIKLLNATERKMPGVFAGFGKAKDSDMIPKVMRTIITEKQITFSNLLSLHFNDISESELDAMVKVFKKVGYVKLKNIGGEILIEYVPKEKRNSKGIEYEEINKGE